MSNVEQCSNQLQFINLDLISLLIFFLATEPIINGGAIRPTGHLLMPWRVF